MIAADLARWLATRWSWVKPRTVPLLVAFAGMLAILGATKYLSTFAIGDDLRMRASVDVSKRAPGSFAAGDPRAPSPPPQAASGFEPAVETTLDQPASRR